MKPPPETRVTIDSIDRGRWRIVIPGRATGGLLFFTLLFLCWLAGWAIGEVFALRALFARDKNPDFDFRLFAWVVAWTFGGIAAVWLLRRVLECAFGAEMLLLYADRSRYLRSLWGRVSVREIPTREIRGIEIVGRWGLRLRAAQDTWVFGVPLTADERVWLRGELARILDELRSEPPLDGGEEAS